MPEPTTTTASAFGLTVDGAIVLLAISAIAIIYALWLAIQAIRSNGVARVWGPLMFGWGGVTIAPWLVLISTSAEVTIPAHEQIHVKQMRKLGLFGFAKFWWRYLTDKQQRLEWEVEAYRESYRLNPAGLLRYAYYLQQYGVDLTQSEAIELITRKTNGARP